MFFGGGAGGSLTTVMMTVTTPVPSVSSFSSTVGTSEVPSTVFQTETYPTSFVLKPTNGQYGCMYRALKFDADKGDTISAGVESSAPISIYIMTANDYQAWEKGKSCSAGSALYVQQKVSNTQAHMVAPSTGEYDLVFLNFSSNGSASVSLNFVGVSQTLTTVSVPAVSAFPTTETYNATSIATETRTVSDPLQQYGMFFIPVLSAVILALQRRSSKRTMGTVPPAAGRGSRAVKRYCGECGNAISMQARFCPKCGAGSDDS
jgi:hypothetical protein